MVDGTAPTRDRRQGAYAESAAATRFKPAHTRVIMGAVAGSRPKTSRGTAFPTPSPASSTGPLKMKAAEIIRALSGRADHARSTRS